ncbi:MAG: TlpA disulfide reductase family protein [Nitrospira sp.]|nr:TlpA family protein disulfide reductase [Nitrospira sp.]
MADNLIATHSPQKSEVPAKGNRLVVTLSAIGVFAAVLGLVWMQSSKYEPLAVGKQAPDFALVDLNDKSVKLSDLRGKVVFLNFWATWCKPCKEEMPSMQVLYKSFEKDGLVVLAVSIDRVTTTKDIPPFLKSMNLTFPVLVDSWGRTDMPYKRTGVPETFIIDREGVIREIVIGPRDWTRLDSLTVLTGLLGVTPKTVKVPAST